MAAAVAAEAKNGHRLLSFEELAQLPPPHEDVVLPEMGDVTIRLYAISGSERARLGAMADYPDGDQQAELAFVCQVIAAALPDSTPEDIAKLPASVVRRLTRASFRLAGMGEQVIREAVEALKEIPNADSGSA